jgi:hypothetical protein
MTPIEASDPKHSKIVDKNLYGDESNISDDELKRIDSKYKVGDKVRMSRYKTKLSKGYTPNYTEEFFLVSKVYPTDPYTYSIVDRKGEDITGRYYDYDLVLYDKQDDIFKIESIIKTRTKNGKKEHFVKWIGYPDKFNSWISEDQLLN